MWLVPSRAQWASWSLPSKLTAIGAFAGIIGIPLAIALFAISAWTQGRDAARAQGHGTAPTQALDPSPESVPRDDGRHDQRPERRNSADSLPLDALLVDLNRQDLTKLQREQMRERLAGRRVRWRVLVRDVTKLYGGDVLLLFISPVQQSELFPDLLSATFPATRGSSLSALRPGDLAVIEGSLGFTRWGTTEWLPELDDSELLSFSTPPQAGQAPHQ